jgi:hypothetical protein
MNANIPLSTRESQANPVFAHESRRHSLPSFGAGRKASCHRIGAMDLSHSEARHSLVSSSYQVSYGKTRSLKRLAGKLSTLLQFKRTKSLPSVPCKPWTSMSSRNLSTSNQDSSMLSEDPGPIMPSKDDKKIVKFGGSSASTSATLEHVASYRSSTNSISSLGAMVDGHAFDAATHDLLKAMQTCMRKSLTDESILQRPLLSNLKSDDFDHAQKVHANTFPRKTS